MYSSPFEDVWDALEKLRENAKNSDFAIANSLCDDIGEVAEKVMELERRMRVMTKDVTKLTGVVMKQNEAIKAIGTVLLKERERGVR